MKEINIWGLDSVCTAVTPVPKNLYVCLVFRPSALLYFSLVIFHYFLLYLVTMEMAIPNIDVVLKAYETGKNSLPLST